MSTLYENKTLVTRVVSQKVCDGCQKGVSEKEYDESWYSFSASHNEWGNDSVESFEYHDVCSSECYIKLVKTLLGEFEEYSGSTVIDDKKYEFLSDLVGYSG